MDQLIYASLSHTHYWYEVGMLKVPYIKAFVYVGKPESVSDIREKKIIHIFPNFQKACKNLSKVGKSL